MTDKKCLFCGGDTEYWYNIDNYEVCGCKNCATSFVNNMPTDKELSDFYDGFKFCINTKNKLKIVSKAYKYFYDSFNLPKNAKMLDIGGGGGFFSSAFERFGFGKSTYIDIDAQACEYAHSLGISNVINANVCDLKNISDERYDFIYCRHVVEHLVNPVPVIDAAIDLLDKGGVFVLQFPNGKSLERLASRKFRQQRIKTLMDSNKDFSYLKALKTIYSSRTGNDVYPPRHLWGITVSGIKEYLSAKENISYTIEVKSIRDKIWSPYYVDTKDYLSFSMLLHEMVFGGCHIICKIKKLAG